MKVLLKQREEDKLELEKKVLTNVKDLVLPYVEKLKNSRLKARDRTLIDIVDTACPVPSILCFSLFKSIEFWSWIYYEDQANFMYYLAFLNGKLQRIVGSPCNPDDADCFDLR
jgi:hypothetical protein